MDFTTEDKFNVEHSKSKFVTKEKFSIFKKENSSLIKKEETKDVFDYIGPIDKNINENEITDIEKKIGFNEESQKGLEDGMGGRTNFITYNEFTIPKKKITEEQKIIDEYNKEQDKKQKETEKEIGREIEIRNILKEKNEGDVKNFYEEQKNRIKTKINNYNKPRLLRKKRLLRLAAACFIIAFFLIIYIIIHERLIQRIFG